MSPGLDEVTLPAFDEDDLRVLDLVGGGLPRDAVARRLGVPAEEVARTLDRMCIRARLPHVASLTARRVLTRRADEPVDLPPRAQPGEAGQNQVRLLALVARGLTVADAATFLGIGPDHAKPLVTELLATWSTTVEGAVAALAAVGRIGWEQLCGDLQPVARTHGEEPPGDGARRLMTGSRRDLAVHARVAVLEARRSVVVDQEGDLALAVARWRAAVGPEVVTVGVHAPGQRVVGRQPLGCPIVCRARDLAGAVAGPGRVLMVTTREGVQVLAEAHRTAALPHWDTLVAEDIVALDAMGLAVTVLSDNHLPVRRRVLQSTVTRIVGDDGRLRGVRAGDRLGTATRLGPATARGYRLEIVLSIPGQRSDGPALLGMAADTLLKAAARPGTGRVVVCCPEDRTAGRILAAVHARTAPEAATQPSIKGRALTARQSTEQRRAALGQLAHRAPVILAATEPLPHGTPMDALMITGAARRPWQTLSAIERALAEPAADLLLLLAPADLAPTRRGTTTGLADALTLVRTLAALSPSLRRRLADWDQGNDPGEAWNAGGPLDWVTLHGELPDHTCAAIADTLLHADRPLVPATAPPKPRERARRPAARPGQKPLGLGRVAGLHLYQLRTGTGLELRHVSPRIGMSTVRLSRAERGCAPLPPETAGQLLELYHADRQDREEILDLCRQAQAPTGGDRLLDGGRRRHDRLGWAAGSAIDGRVSLSTTLPSLPGLGRRITVLLDDALLTRSAATRPGRQDLTRLQDQAVVLVVPRDEASGSADLAEFRYSDQGAQSLYATWEPAGVLYRVGPAAAKIGAALDGIQARALPETTSRELLNAHLTGAAEHESLQPCGAPAEDRPTTRPPLIPSATSAVPTALSTSPGTS
ncbi:helix-turn-helix domain-containing protein [Kitasatospora sp. NPDC058046]|uniref:helix-turn-helix domain-containing protein n=1 Tax=Kitasatospora sp. NPDC058046 TaxID=3346312 RepID=UPI0036D7B580